MAKFPTLLVHLNQFESSVEDVFSVRCVCAGFIGPVLMGVAIALVVFAVQRFLRRPREKHAPTKVGG